MSKFALEQMTREEKLELLDALWADLAKDDSIESPEWHAQELAETERRVAAGEEPLLDFDEAMKQLRERLK